MPNIFRETVKPECLLHFIQIKANLEDNDYRVFKTYVINNEGKRIFLREDMLNPNYLGHNGYIELNLGVGEELTIEVEACQAVKDKICSVFLRKLAPLYG